MPSRSSRSLVDMVRQRDATMEEVALLIARDRYPHLSLDHYTRHLDRMAAPLQARMDEGMELDERAHMLLGYVFGELGFRGDRQTYHDPDNSYLNRVLERRAGIPISLAVVLMALGRRMRLRVEGINFPGHFLVRIGGEPGTVVDPFEGKGPLDREYLTALARKVLGPKARLRDEHLAPATLKVMATRMLLNLKPR
jgi:regulator of sirC expression with transglutaminase-like and TPR domain